MRGKMMIAVFFLLAIFSLNSFCKTPAAKQKTKMDPLPPEAVQYLKALEAFNKTEGRRSMEPLYESAYVAAHALTIGFGDKDWDYIERNVSDEITLAEVQKQVPGIEIDWWSESHSANPDMEYFLALAEKKGLEADTAFFSILKEQFDGNWANYIKATWDLGGCTKYGSLILTSNYTRWADFRNQYPQSYIERSSEIMRNIEFEFTRGINSCGDKDDVLREFRAFVKTIDDPDLEIALLKRMGEIENGTSDMRSLLSQR